jgi:uncharacterized protein YraI
VFASSIAAIIGKEYCASAGRIRVVRERTCWCLRTVSLVASINTTTIQECTMAPYNVVKPSKKRIMLACALPLIVALLLACGSGSSISKSAVVNATSTSVPVSDTQDKPQRVHLQSAEEVDPTAVPSLQARAIRTSNLREGPGTAFAIARELPKGTTVELLSYHDEGDTRWYEVQVDNTQGWMSSIVLEVDGEVAQALAENTDTFTPPPTATPKSARATPKPAPAEPEPASVAQSCDPSYPDVCIPPKSEVGDLDCPDISYRRFRVIGNDPHRFDADNDGIGCER